MVCHTLPFSAIHLVSIKHAHEYVIAITLSRHFLVQYELLYSALTPMTCEIRWNHQWILPYLKRSNIIRNNPLEIQVLFLVVTVFFSSNIALVDIGSCCSGLGRKRNEKQSECLRAHHIIEVFS